MWSDHNRSNFNNPWDNQDIIKIQQAILDTDAVLVGSRFLKIDNEDSDWDFLTKATRANIQRFIDLGFDLSRYSENDQINMIKVCATKYIGDTKIQIIFTNEFHELYGVYQFCKVHNLFNKDTKKAGRIAVFHLLCQEMNKAGELVPEKMTYIPRTPNVKEEEEKK